MNLSPFGSNDQHRVELCRRWVQDDINLNSYRKSYAFFRSSGSTTLALFQPSHSIDFTYGLNNHSGSLFIRLPGIELDISVCPHRGCSSYNGGGWSCAHWQEEMEMERRIRQTVSCRGPLIRGAYVTDFQIKRLLDLVCLDRNIPDRTTPAGQKQLIASLSEAYYYSDELKGVLTVPSSWGNSLHFVSFNLLYDFHTCIFGCNSPGIIPWGFGFRCHSCPLLRDHVTDTLVSWFFPACQAIFTELELGVFNRMDEDHWISIYRYLYGMGMTGFKFEDGVLYMTRGFQLLSIIHRAVKASGSYCLNNRTQNICCRTVKKSGTVRFDLGHCFCELCSKKKLESSDSPNNGDRLDIVQKLAGVTYGMNEPKRPLFANWARAFSCSTNYREAKQATMIFADTTAEPPSKLSKYDEEDSE